MIIEMISLTAVMIETNLMVETAWIVVSIEAMQVETAVKISDSCDKCSQQL